MLRVAAIRTCAAHALCVRQPHTRPQHALQMPTQFAMPALHATRRSTLHWPALGTRTQCAKHAVHRAPLTISSLLHAQHSAIGSAATVLRAMLAPTSRPPALLPATQCAQHARLVGLASTLAAIAVCRRTLPVPHAQLALQAAHGPSGRARQKQTRCVQHAQLVEQTSLSPRLAQLGPTQYASHAKHAALAHTRQLHARTRLMQHAPRAAHALLAPMSTHRAQPRKTPSVPRALRVAQHALPMATVGAQPARVDTTSTTDSATSSAPATHLPTRNLTLVVAAISRVRHAHLAPTVCSACHVRQACSTRLARAQRHLSVPATHTGLGLPVRRVQPTAAHAWVQVPRNA